MSEQVVATPAVIFAAVLALVLEWLPGVSTWWQALTPAKRTALNALGVALISIIAMWLGCARGNTCPADPWDAAWQFIVTALLSLGVNQAAYQVVKEQNFE